MFKIKEERNGVSELSQLFGKLGTVTLKLYKEKEFLHRILNTDRDLILVVEVGTGRIIFANSSAKRLLDDIEGKPISLIFPNLDLGIELEQYSWDILEFNDLGKLAMVQATRIRSKLNGKVEDYAIFHICLFDNSLVNKMIGCLNERKGIGKNT